MWDSIVKTLITEDRWKSYLTGLGNTLLISIGALVIGLILGIIMSLILYLNKKYGIMKIPKKIINGMLAIFRGTPVVLQLMIVTFVILSSVNTILAAMIAFGFNSSAYVCEIFRGGLEAVDDGQLEAGKSVGLSTFQTMIYIILPQAIKKALPPLGNEFIALIKETSIVGYVAVDDITRVAYNIQSLTFDAFMPLVVAAILYLIIVLTLTQLLKILERKLAKSDREGGDYDRKAIRAATRKV